MAMSFEYIRKAYKVPAKRGGRVEYTGHGAKIMGTIRSAKQATAFHPTWKLRFLAAPEISSASEKGMG